MERNDANVMTASGGGRSGDRGGGGGGGGGGRDGKRAGSVVNMDSDIDGGAAFRGARGFNDNLNDVGGEDYGDVGMSTGYDDSWGDGRTGEFGDGNEIEGEEMAQEHNAYQL